MIFLEPYKQYVTISGRATRKEYWVFVFFICVVASWLLALDNFLFPDTELGEGWTFLIFSAFSTIPYCTVTVRRLHDADRSGWWFFAGFLPLICFLPMYFLCVVSTPGDNRFGEQSLKTYRPRSLVLQLVFWVVGILLLITPLFFIVGEISDDKSDEMLGEMAKEQRSDPEPGHSLFAKEDPQLELNSLNLVSLPNHEELYTGQYGSWYEDGQKMMEGTYKEGKHDGLWTTWHENGQKRTEFTYKEGKHDGFWSAWDEDGQNMIEGNYKGGKKDGLWTDWLERKEGTYKGGEQDGLWTWWDEQGNLTKQTYYKNGAEVP